MINSDRRRKLAEEKLAGLEAARDLCNTEADRREYSDLIAELQSEIAEYASLKSGLIRVFAVTELDDLGPALVKARIASGKSQAELAREMGVTEQNVQRDETREYETAGLARVAELLDALGYELVGTVRPRTRPVATAADMIEDQNFGSGFAVVWPRASLPGSSPTAANWWLLGGLMDTSLAGHSAAHEREHSS